ncbi:alpha/beta hydrolase family esterase [Puia sp. P3]|uniref:alpha/beta hydrolase family esterase n=1 Tax=Puia sp. P3 TaxID=3423952 RepID=UPI003D6695C7
MTRYLFRIALLLLCPIAFANCQKGDPGKTFRFNGRLSVDGLSRTYLLNLPPNYYESSNLPLVIALHGFGGTSAEMERDYGITDKGNAEGFVVAYPDGVPSNGPFRLRSWNAGRCCFVAESDNIDDVHFISSLIDQLVANYKIDPKKVYVAGMSNGAMMTYTLACALSEKIAAITSVSGTLMASSPCQPSRAVPILHIHSALDTKVPFNGGYGMDNVYFSPVDSGLSVWAMNDSCDTPPSVTDGAGYTLTEWKDLHGRVAIDSYLTSDGGHSLAGRTKAEGQGRSTVYGAKRDRSLMGFFPAVYFTVKNRRGHAPLFYKKLYRSAIPR